MKLPNVIEIMNLIEKEAKDNDRKISDQEDEILSELAKLPENANRLDIYKTILKTVYKDGYVEKDEEDIVLFAKKLLNIKLSEHQKILYELKFI